MDEKGKMSARKSKAESAAFPPDAQEIVRQRLADILVREAKRVDGIIDEFLNFARIRKLKRTRIQVGELLAGAGVKTLLLDIVPFDLKDDEKDDPIARNRIAQAGLDRRVSSY